MNRVRIGTRKSALAVWQAEHVGRLLRERYPDLQIELVKLSTRGDQLSGPLTALGGKGLFTREIEEALLAGEVDLAVHSLKDLPAQTPPGLALAAPPRREDARDVLCSRDGLRLADLPKGARVGTGSLRRELQLRALRPELAIEPIRGNVSTRLERLRGPTPLDAVILAAAGLRRLGLQDHISQAFEPSAMLPCVGQGILGLERRAEDQRLAELLVPLADRETEVRMQAERALLGTLGAGCNVPLGGHAWFEQGVLHLEALLMDPANGAQQRVRGQEQAARASALGERLGAELLAGPARRVLQLLEVR